MTNEERIDAYLATLNPEYAEHFNVYRDGGELVIASMASDQGGSYAVWAVGRPLGDVLWQFSTSGDIPVRMPRSPDDLLGFLLFEGYHK